MLSSAGSEPGPLRLPPRRAADVDSFTAGVVRSAFVARLGSLLLGMAVALGQPGSGRTAAAVVLMAASSAAGLYGGERVVSLVRRHPLVAALDVLVATAVTALVGVGNGLVFLTLSTALLIGVLLSQRDAVLMGGLLVLGYLAAALSTAPTDTAGLTYLFVVPVADAALVALGLAVSRLHRQALAEQQELGGLREQAAAAEERARLARDMHDSVAKSLHGIALAAEALEGWVERDPVRAQSRARDLAQAAETAAAEARQLLVGLRREADDGPLLTLLERRVAAFEAATGTPAMLEAGGVADVDDDLRLGLLAIVDEALENVVRHADARAVVVSCEAAGEHVVVTVRDDGAGIAPTRCATAEREGRFGLRGMRERAELLGGRLDVGPGRNGAGTLVRAVVPRTAGQAVR